MGEEALNLRHASTTFLGGRPIVLWLVAAGHVVFAAMCSPQGIRSGDWSVPWLPNADALVFVASGATLVYPLILFPLWTALGCGAGMRRVAASFLFCLAFVVAVVVRGMFRDIHEPQILPAAFGMVSFLLVSLCLWWAQRFWKWRLGTCDAPPTPYRAHRSRPQFRLKHLLAVIALAACVLALFRYNFPDGVPRAVALQWWRQLAALGQAVPVTVLFLLPTVSVPWLVLAVRDTGRTTIFVATAVLIGWVTFDYALCSLTGPLPFTGQDFLWVQLGAVAAATISSVVLRFCGYRLFRVETGQEYTLRHRETDSPSPRRY